MSNFSKILFNWLDIISATLEYSILLVLTTPDSSPGRNLLDTRREMNCFCILSSVLSALSTLDLVVGSTSWTSMENSSLGFFNLSEIPIPHSTVFLVDTDDVSAISVASEVLVVYTPLTLRSLSIMLPLNLMLLPSLRAKSFLAIPRATKWKDPVVIL